MKQPIVTPRGVPHEDMAREEQLHSLLDGRARWPDGTPREIGVPLYERMRQREILSKRNDCGADTPLGRRLSKEAEQRLNLRTAVGDQAVRLRKDLAQTVRERAEMEFLA